MKIKKVTISTNISVSTSIFLIVIGSYLIRYRNIAISSIIFLLAVTVAAFGLALVVRQLRVKKQEKELYLGVGLIIAGVMAAIFNNSIVQIGLIAIGVLFAVFGFMILFNHLHSQGWLYLVLGIARVLIGAALVGLAFTSGGDVQKLLALLTGIVATVLGVSFLIFEK